MTSLRMAAAAAAALVMASPASAQTARTPVPETGYQDGFFVQTANGDYRLVFGAIAQLDGRFSLDDEKPIVNTFTLRKLRPTVSGRIARHFEFKLMPDFGNGTAVVQDAYFDMRLSPRLRIRTGKEKTPVGYELLNGDPYLLFPQRALASSLVPNRDLGVSALGDLSPNVFYTLGIYNGMADGASSTTELDSNNGKDVAGRVVLQPFRSATAPTPLSGLGVHVGFSHGSQTGALPAFRTSVGQSYFSYAAGASADGRRTRFTPAVFYYYKALGVFGEWMRSTQDVSRGGATTEVSNTAWEVSGSLVLTGETGADRGVRPRNNFDPPEGRFGALQLVTRYSHIGVDDELFAARLASAGASNGASQFTIGANWYPNPQLKYYATYERVSFDNQFTTPQRADEHVVIVRAQLAF
jgi:phosphate-selective porin OprO and OprP